MSDDEKLGAHLQALANVAHNQMAYLCRESNEAATYYSRLPSYDGERPAVAAEKVILRDLIAAQRVVVAAANDALTAWTQS